MINLTMMATVGALILAVVGYVYYKVHKIKVRAEKLSRANIELTQRNQQLLSEKAVVEKQVKNFQVKQKHEENTHSLGRDGIVAELRQNNDIRPD
jgi:hypothetical protein|nr:MAG TPA: Protein of unknown function (DUF2681) [Caudoviricetes sp.]